MGAQNLGYVKQLVDTLASEQYHGRGYVNNGGKKAATFLKSEFEKAGLQHVAYQPFTHSVNTFPGKLEVAVDGQPLKPGVDYLVQPTSGAAQDLHLQLVRLSPKRVKSLKKFNRFLSKYQWSECALVLSKEVYTQINDDAIGQALIKNSFGAAAIITTTNQKLTWSVRDYAKSYAELEIMEEALGEKSTHINITIEQKLVYSFKNQNILGYLPGKKPDSLIVFTAHYDHLGQMGNEATFYGTNDNAGGAAMLCDLARHFAADTARAYSMLFIAFAGEEAGLVGSKYYVEHPVYPLQNISLLINLDLVTNGQDGITVVNGRVFKQVFKKLKGINEAHHWMADVKSRGAAANSDHYYFGEAGVKAIFIYLLGEYPYYHDINDTPEKPSWAGYNDFFRLLVELCNQWVE
ncbi:M28 family peptidase [bacterium]|nr:M28 family peptidase [bacterium]